MYTYGVAAKDELPAPLTIIARPIGSTAGEWLQARFSEPKWTTFRACAAFLKQSGAKHVAPDLYDFTRRPGTNCQIAVGISSRGTSFEGVSTLWRVLEGFGEFFIYHEGVGGRGSYHPKGYIFKNDEAAHLLLGSANFTEGGLFVNHELSVSIHVDLRVEPPEWWGHLESAFDVWQTPSATCLPVNAALIQDLVSRGDLPTEEELRIVARAARSSTLKPEANPLPIPPDRFGSSTAPAVPQPRPLPADVGPPPGSPVAPPPAISVRARSAKLLRGGLSSLVIEVRPHHNGELFLSYTAVDDNRGFFQYPFTGWTVPKRRGNPPYPQLAPDPVVDITIYDAAGAVLRRKPLHALNVVDYTKKREIRITIPDGLHADIPQMSVLVMTKDPTPSLDYRLQFYPPGSAPDYIASRLVNKLPSGGAPVARRYGWL